MFLKIDLLNEWSKRKNPMHARCSKLTEWGTSVVLSIPMIFKVVFRGFYVSGRPTTTSMFHFEVRNSIIDRAVLLK